MKVIQQESRALARGSGASVVLPRDSNGLSRLTVFLLALAAGASVANLYWAQPLLAPIATAFGVGSDRASLVITLTQVGYAVGAFLIVPLGDVFNRRRLIPVIMALNALALAMTLWVPSFTAALVVFGAIGLLSVAGQIIVPLVGDLSSASTRGQALGIVASGIVLGIQISRAVSGLIAAAWGWRAIFIVSTIVMVLLSAPILAVLPSEHRSSTPSYGRALWDVVKAPFSDSRIPVALLFGAAPMCVFTLFWTGLTLLLSGTPFSFSTAQIGLVGLLAIVGVFVGQPVGALIDKGKATPTLGWSLLGQMVALFIAALGQKYLAVMCVAVVVFSISIQAGLVVAQTIMLMIKPRARSRMNTTFVVSNFIASALGSTLAATLWAVAGWRGLMVCALVILGVTFSVWAITRTTTQA